MRALRAVRNSTHIFGRAHAHAHARSSASLAYADLTVVEECIANPSPLLAHPHRAVVISAIGEDRVGVIHGFMSALTSCQGHATQSHMSRLGSDFAIMVHARLPRLADVGVLKERIENELPGFGVEIRGTVVPEIRRVEEVWGMKVEIGTDEVGILNAVARCVGHWGGNFVRLESEKVGNGGVVRGIVYGLGGGEELGSALEEVERHFRVKVWLEYGGVDSGRAA